jgi:hypothetical protein
LLLAVTARADEPGGFLDRPWGTRWDRAAIASLPGCARQGELVADIEGYVALVAQPECVGYRLSERQRVTLILFYAEIKWHAPDSARRIVTTLLAHRRLWGLRWEAAARLESVAEGLDALAAARRHHGPAPPIVPELHTGAFPTETDGLQGYQMNFASAGYDAVQSTVARELGPATERASDAVGGETLTWVGPRTLAILSERGQGGASGYFVIVTTEYLRALSARTARPPGIALWANPMSRPGVLEIVEWFDWARDR